MFTKLAVSLIAAALALPLAAQQPAPRFEYRVLATSKTSAMEKEMNEAADAGYRFGGVMGGDTAIGGKEVVVVMIKDPRAKSDVKRVYKLLATSRTSTMQKELDEAGEQGFELCGVLVGKSAFGCAEVISILKKNGK